MGNYKFDLDLPDGEFAERLICELFLGERGTVEVKRDFKVTKTGNLAIEYECHGKPSGIATTKATWWVFCLDGEKFAHELMIWIRTDRLKALVHDYYKRGHVIHGGDSGSSVMVLIPVVEFVRYVPRSMQADMI